jgi:hypothetical protein
MSWDIAPVSRFIASEAYTAYVPLLGGPQLTDLMESYFIPLSPHCSPVDTTLIQVPFDEWPLQAPCIVFLSSIYEIKTLRTSDFVE